MIAEISLDRIKSSDFFRLSYPLNPKGWAAIAEKLPQFPLLVIDGKNRLVAGHDFLTLIKRRRTSPAHAFRFNGQEGEALLFAYHFKSLLAGFNPYEKLIFIHKVLAYFPPADIQQRSGIDLSVKELSNEDLAGLLHRRYRFLLTESRIGIKPLMRLHRFAPADREAMIEILRQVPFNENQQSRLFDLAEELLSRGDAELSEIFERAEIHQFMEIEMPQKKILDALMKYRFPEFSRLSGEFDEKIRRAAGDLRIQVTPHPYFEKKSVQMTLQCRDLDEALEMIKKIKSALPDPVDTP